MDFPRPQLTQKEEIMKHDREGERNKEEGERCHFALRVREEFPSLFISSPKSICLAGAREGLRCTPWW